MNLFEATQSTSKYEGISWNEKRKLWQAEFYSNGKKSKAYFENEFDAAKTINQHYRKSGILPQNSEINEMPNPQVILSCLCQALLKKNLHNDFCLFFLSFLLKNFDSHKSYLNTKLQIK